MPPMANSQARVKGLKKAKGASLVLYQTEAARDAAVMTIMSASRPLRVRSRRMPTRTIAGQTR